MLRFCGLIIALTLSVPVYSQEPVTEPVTIEASTPEGLIAKALGVQLEAVVVTLIKGREFFERGSRSYRSSAPSI